MRLSRRNALTRYVKLAVKLQRTLFSVLYSCPYHIKVDNEQLFCFKFEKLTTRFIPWIFSFFFVTLGCGWTSCSVIIVHQIVCQRPLDPWVQWNFYATIITVLLRIASTLEVVIVITIALWREFSNLIYMLQWLERKS